jgi:uncharacterized protein
MIYISEDDLQIINEILKRYPYSFYAYGSRVKGKGQKFSDLDLCIIDQTISVPEVTSLKEELEESNLPFTVDIGFWFMMNKDFQGLIEKDLILIQANPYFIKAENNQFSKCTYLPRSLGYPVIDKGFATIVNCGLNSTMFNSVIRIKFDDHVDERIQGIIDQYNKKPFAWWLGCRDAPADLGSRLEKYGFKKHGTEYAMFCRLDEFKPFELDKNIIIEQVSTVRQIEDFIVALIEYDKNIGEFFNDKVISPEVMDKNPLFVSYMDGKPVGNGSLHFSDDVAGIYDIITAENLRGQGIGTNMMKYLMNFVHKKGYSEICLSTSSDMAFKIYTKLGFKVVGMYGCYEWS